MKLDLDNPNVQEITASVAQVRSYFDGMDIDEVIPDFTSMLDMVQGNVFTGEHKVSYLVIKVTP